MLEFHKKYGCTIGDCINTMSEHERLLRIRLMAEELTEFITAASLKNLNGMVDALGDLLYVTFGTAIAMGLDMEPVVAEIHKSNMTKEMTMDGGGKIVKGPNYKPPNICKVLHEQTKED